MIENLPQFKSNGMFWDGTQWVRFTDRWSLRVSTTRKNGGEVRLTIWHNTERVNDPELAKALYTIWRLSQ